MLILVAVTINLATNGGLFTKSRKATRDTEEQAIYDQIVSAMELKDDGKINPSDTFESFKKKFTSYEIEAKGESTASKIVFTVKGARDTYTYTITEDEIIIGEKEPQNQGEIDWNKYVNGETVPKFTINSVIPTKEWDKWPTTNYDGKGPNEVRFQIIINNSDPWDYQYEKDNKCFSIFHGDNESYDYYWNESDSPIGKAGWIFKPTNGTPIVADTLPEFTNCTIELYDTVPDNEKTEYAEKLNTFLKDIFILVNE